MIIFLSCVWFYVPVFIGNAVPSNIINVFPSSVNIGTCAQTGEQLSIEGLDGGKGSQAFILCYLGNGFRRTSKRAGGDDRASDVQALSQDKCTPYAEINITLEDEEASSFLIFLSSLP